MSKQQYEDAFYSAKRWESKGQLSDAINALDVAETRTRDAE